jgi:hypothetical protein
MTASTRRKLMLCLVIGLIALPAEALLLPVARTPNPAEAAVEWTATLDDADLREAAGNIDAYPALYRRAIMAKLSPTDRAFAWRTFFENYRASHPSLSSSQIAVIEDAMALATSDAFVLPVRPEVKERINLVFERATREFGKAAAAELFVTLGPRMPARANALPLTQRIADRVRSWRVASAQEEDPYPDCNCNPEMDTCDIMPDPWLQCSELFTCNFDLVWPMCGPFWAWACTGWCRVLRWPWEEDGVIIN